MYNEILFSGRICKQSTILGNREISGGRHRTRAPSREVVANEGCQEWCRDHQTSKEGLVRGLGLKAGKLEVRGQRGGREGTGHVCKYLHVYHRSESLPERFFSGRH